MEDNINNFVEKISRRYSAEYQLDYEDLRQALFLEYYKLIKKPSYLSKKAEPNFDEPAYIFQSLKNRCLKIARDELKFRDNVPLYLDTTSETYIEGVCSDLVYDYKYDHFAGVVDVVHDALSVLDEQSRRYVITLGYLKANLSFLENDFNEIVKDCTEEELIILSSKPTDRNIAKYVMNLEPNQIKRIKIKLRKNKKFINILKEN